MSGCWTVLKSESILTTPWFELRKDRCQTPEGAIVPEYYTWKKRDCVIVFPVTEDNHVLLIKQYRHGVQKICVDYPGGTIDDGQSVLDAAHLELIEETGYYSEACTPIASYLMDSSYSNQKTHFVMALECKKASKTSNAQEVTEVFKVPISDISQFAENKIDCLLCSLVTWKALCHLGIRR